MRRRSRRSRLTHLAIPTALVAGLAGACSGEVRRGDADLQVRLIVEPTPTPPGPVDIRLEVSDVDWSPETGARVTVSASMEGASPALVVARGEGAGGYVAEGVVLRPEGEWLLTTRIESVDGRWAEVEHRVLVGAPVS